jgi:hypothetical protein
MHTKRFIQFPKSKFSSVSSVYTRQILDLNLLVDVTFQVRISLKKWLIKEQVISAFVCLLAEKASYVASQADSWSIYDAAPSSITWTSVKQKSAVSASHVAIY